MSETTQKLTQVQLLETTLRGKGVELTAAQARAKYGIKNLRARMTDLRQAGLNVKTRVNYRGANAYSITARDTFGSRKLVTV
jgi:hypothetical protein